MRFGYWLGFWGFKKALSRSNKYDWDLMLFLFKKFHC